MKTPPSFRMRNLSRGFRLSSVAMKARYVETVDDKIAQFARCFDRYQAAKRQGWRQGYLDVLTDLMDSLGQQIDVSEPDIMKAVMDAASVPGGGRDVIQDENEARWRHFLLSYLYAMAPVSPDDQDGRISIFRDLPRADTQRLATFFFHLSDRRTELTQKDLDVQAAVSKALPVPTLTPDLWIGIRQLSEKRRAYFEAIQDHPAVDVVSVAEEFADQLFGQIVSGLTPDIVDGMTDSDYADLYKGIQGSDYTHGHRTKAYENNLIVSCSKTGLPPAMVRHRQHQLVRLEERFADYLSVHEARLLQAKEKWPTLSPDQKGDILTDFLELATEVFELPSMPNLSFFAPTLSVQHSSAMNGADRFVVEQTQDDERYLGGAYRAFSRDKKDGSLLWENRVRIALSYVDDRTKTEKPFAFRWHVLCLFHEALHADDRQQGLLVVTPKILNPAILDQLRAKAGAPLQPEDPLRRAYETLVLRDMNYGRNVVYAYNDLLYSVQPVEAFVRVPAPYMAAAVNGMLVAGQVRRQERCLHRDVGRVLSDAAAVMDDYWSLCIQRQGFAYNMESTLPPPMDIGIPEPWRISAPPLTRLGMTPLPDPSFAENNRAGIAEMKDRLMFLTRQPKMDDVRLVPFYLDIVPSMLHIAKWARYAEEMYGICAKPMPAPAQRLELSAQQLAFDLIDFAYRVQPPAQRRGPHVMKGRLSFDG